MRPYVAGATALNRDGRGFSRHIDVFNDREGSVGAEADTDVTLLGNDGFEVRSRRRGHWPSSAEISSAMIS